jgi:hypothetical protein
MLAPSAAQSPNAPAVNFKPLHADPSVLFDGLNHLPASERRASPLASTVWRHTASRPARAMCALVTNVVSPAMIPRASGRQWGANSPDMAGTNTQPAESSTDAAKDSF